MKVVDDRSATTWGARLDTHCAKHTYAVDASTRAPSDATKVDGAAAPGADRPWSWTRPAGLATAQRDWLALNRRPPWRSALTRRPPRASTAPVLSDPDHQRIRHVASSRLPR